MNSDKLKPTAYSKVKKIPVTRHALADLFKERNHLIEVTDGLPKDAEVVRIDYEHDRDTYYFIVESEQFDPVKEGEKIPETDVEFAKHEKQEKDDLLPNPDPLDIPDPEPNPRPNFPDYPPERKYFCTEKNSETIADTTIEL